MGSFLAKKDGLTDLQSRFVDEYLIDFNASRAAKAAGYAESSADRRGWELTKHPKVSAAIRERGNVTAEEVGLSRRYVLTKATEILEKSLNGAPKIVGHDPEIARDENGNIIYQWSPAGANAALALIAKLRGDLIDRTQVDTRSIQIEINGVNLEDLTSSLVRLLRCRGCRPTNGSCYVLSPLMMPL